MAISSNHRLATIISDWKFFLATFPAKTTDIQLAGRFLVCRYTNLLFLGCALDKSNLRNLIPWLHFGIYIGGAGDANDRRSTSSICFLIGGNLFTGYTKKQLVVIRSSSMAGYHAMTHIT